MKRSSGIKHAKLLFNGGNNHEEKEGDSKNTMLLGLDGDSS